jgi:hypothetical protein
MPLAFENARKQYKVGQEPKVVHSNVYNFSVAELSKDVVRELAREARMPNYSHRTKEEMVEFLNAQDELPLHHVQLRVIRKL